MVIVGDCRERLREMADGSVQTCVTSPPYFALRSYLPDRHPDKGKEIGLESSLDAYVADLVAVFREVRRVLRDDGSLWLNLGDSYASDTKGSGGQGKSGLRRDGRDEASRIRSADISIDHQKYAPRRFDLSAIGAKPKDLLGVPWRVAFALQADGWYLRSDIVWHKPNPMPESVRDRPTKAHEYVFLLTKSPRYFYDADAIAERAAESTQERAYLGQRPITPQAQALQDNGTYGKSDRLAVYDRPTRNKRTVWTITPKPFKGAHFAVMPPALVEPCILAGTSERGQCPECGAPWRRVVERELTEPVYVSGKNVTNGDRNDKGRTMFMGGGATTTGWQPSCTCNAGEPVPQTVLDPFCGAGTVGVVALSHGRRFVGVELNPEYARMAEARIAREVRPRVLALPLTEALEGAAD